MDVVTIHFLVEDRSRGRLFSPGPAQFPELLCCRLEVFPDVEQTKCFFSCTMLNNTKMIKMQSWAQKHLSGSRMHGSPCVCYVSMPSLWPTEDTTAERVERLVLHDSCSVLWLSECFHVSVNACLHWVMIDLYINALLWLVICKFFHRVLSIQYSRLFKTFLKSYKMKIALIAFGLAEY